MKLTNNKLQDTTYPRQFTYSFYVGEDRPTESKDRTVYGLNKRTKTKMV